MTENTVDVYEDKAVVARMVERYVAAGTEKSVEGDAARAAVVAELAEELGKSEASVRGKLNFEGVYIAKGRTTKNGKAVVSKSDLADKIEAYALVLGVIMAENDVESLTKATKGALTALVEVFTKVNDEMGILRGDRGVETTEVAEATETVEA